MRFQTRWRPFSGAASRRIRERATGAEEGPSRRIRDRLAWISGALPPPEEREFSLALDRTLAAMLPVLGAVFGVGVVIFAAWDYWIAAEQAATTTVIRLSMVLVGAAGYFDWGARFRVTWRYMLVYGTHTGAMIVSSALLPNGLILALPALTGVMFPLALVEPRLHRLFLLILMPSLLFAALGAATLPQKLFANIAIIYLLAVVLVAAVAVAQGRLRRAAFLAEQALAYAARHDSLSGAFARGHLVELATRDVALAKRYRRPLTIAMLDIDYFKRVNDTFGHHAGDMLIREVTRVCSAELRSSDYFGRIGGEEFVCVMPETMEDEALACAERMRMAVADIVLATEAGQVRCTISIGVATLHPELADFRELLAAADGALYLAKSKGRDRVELAPAHLIG